MTKKKIEQTEQLIIEGTVEKNKVPTLPAGKEADLKDTQNEISEGQINMFESDAGDAIIDVSVARERLKEAIESDKPKKKKKSIITNLIFLIINIAVLGFIINACLKEANGVPLLDIIKEQGDRMWWLLGGVVLFAIIFFADTMIFYCLIKRSTGKKKFLTAYKVSSVGKYFDAITPFSVGGQPSQILNLTRADISPGVATSIPIIKLIIYNIVYTIIILLFYIVGIPFLSGVSPLNGLLLTLLKIFAFIGIIFTALSSLIFILIGSGKIVGRSLVRWIVKVGYQLRIVKDYRKSYNKIMKTVLEYQSSISYLRKNKATLFACIFFALIEVLSYFAIPFTVVMAFTASYPTSVSSALLLLLICITKFIICQMAAVVVPLPGGTGMMEFSFIAMFGVYSMIGSTNIVWGLLAWRFLTYYFTIVQGFIVSTIDSISRMAKTRKENKKQIASDSTNIA